MRSPHLSVFGSFGAQGSMNAPIEGMDIQEQAQLHVFYMGLVDGLESLWVRFLSEQAQHVVEHQRRLHRWGPRDASLVQDEHVEVNGMYK